MASVFQPIVGKLLEFSQNLTKEVPAHAELQQLLGRLQVLDRSVYGRVAPEDDIGQHVCVRGRDGGYALARIFNLDFIEPLIIRKGTPPVSKIGLRRTATAGLETTPKTTDDACCMTNDKQCGGGLKCTGADDPCASSLMGFELGLAVMDDPSVRRLFDPEIQLGLRLGELLDREFESPTRSSIAEIRTYVGQLRDTYTHRELLFAVEEEANGVWFDWILKLSNGAVLTLQLTTNPRGRPLVFGPQVDPMKSLLHYSSRWSIQESDRGHLVSLFREEYTE